MISILTERIQAARQVRSKQERARKRYLANKESLRRDKEFYRRWVNPPGFRW